MTPQLEALIEHVAGGVKEALTPGSDLARDLSHVLDATAKVFTSTAGLLNGIAEKLYGPMGPSAEEPPPEAPVTSKRSASPAN